TNCLARRRVLRVAVPTRVVPTTQPGDLWGPSEELLFFNGLLRTTLSEKSLPERTQTNWPVSPGNIKVTVPPNGPAQVHNRLATGTGAALSATGADNDRARKGR
ncbi:MAG: hypothetical protein ACI8PQ_003092, partial [Planctomycetota bacterium]